MSANTERFSGRVEAYARFRTRYPEAVLSFLRTTCGLQPAWRVTDVGAGTGMLAELFLDNGNAVTAVEPNAGMRAECERLRARFAQVRVVDGTAEQTWLDRASAEMVTVGRAFHWFDPVGAQREFRRLLVPGGWVAIVSSGRERGAETAQGLAYQELLAQFGMDAEHVRSWAGRQEKTVEFLRDIGAGTEPASTELVTERSIGLEEFMGETQSLSVAPLAGSAGYVAMQDALEKFFATWSSDEVLRVRTVCSVGVAQLK